MDPRRQQCLPDEQRLLGSPPSTTFADPTLCPLTGESYTATFGPSDWFKPLNITVTARNNGPEDPKTVAITETLDAATNDPV